jgi:pimeloyl-ACP methyl ester carboxylesterase
MTNELRMDFKGKITPLLSAGPLPKSGKPMVLLVHGFNNDSVEAKTSYFTMRRNLDNVLRSCEVDEKRRRQIQESIWEFYWPGYKPISDVGPRGEKREKRETLQAAFFYFQDVKKARSWVPDQLADYLRKVGPSEIFFIGHSLGNRVILETIDRLLQWRSIGLPGFLMMAGAVPVHFLTRLGKLNRAAIAATRRFCFYSRRDMVLMLTFPEGQAMAGERPLTQIPVATGTAGWPSGTYTGRSDTKLGHGGYWKQGIFKDESRSQETLAGIFRIATGRGLPEERLLHSVSDQDLSILPSRHLKEWTIPGADWLENDYGPRRGDQDVLSP